MEAPHGQVKAFKPFVGSLDAEEDRGSSGSMQ